MKRDKTILYLGSDDRHGRIFMIYHMTTFCFSPLSITRLIWISKHSCNVCPEWWSLYELFSVFYLQPQIPTLTQQNHCPLYYINAVKLIIQLHENEIHFDHHLCFYFCSWFFVWSPLYIYLYIICWIIIWAAVEDAVADGDCPQQQQQHDNYTTIEEYFVMYVLDAGSRDSMATSADDHDHSWRQAFATTAVKVLVYTSLFAIITTNCRDLSTNHVYRKGFPTRSCTELRDLTPPIGFVVDVVAVVCVPKRWWL